VTDTRYRAWWPDRGDTIGEAIEVNAYDHSQAAEEAAEFDYCHRDGFEKEGVEEEIHTEDAHGKVKKFTVTREDMPSFSASEIP
jgi:hypothetical protein